VYASHGAEFDEYPRSSMCRALEWGAQTRYSEFIDLI
jgi:hypothetical protein